MTSFACRLLAISTALALAVPAFGQVEGALTLDEALQLSLERQPALTAYTRTAQAFEEAAVAARQLPDFTLMAGIQNLPITGSDAFSLSADFMTMRFIGISRQQVRGAKRGAAAARILAQADVSLAEQQLLARRIQREVLLSWTMVQEGQQKQEVLQTLIDKLQGRLRAAEANIPTGQASSADAIAIRAEIAAAEAELEAARGLEAAGRAALARWIGDAARQSVSGAMPICRPPDRQQVLAFVDQHPEIEVARRQGTVAERAIAVARADRQPDWGWTVMYGNRGGGRSDMLTLQVSIDLPLNRARLQNRRVAEASELAAAARDRLEDTRRELLASYEETAAHVRSAEARYRVTAAQTLPALRAAEEALEARYAGTGGSLESILVASERTTRTALQLVDQRAAVGRASADLLFYVEECGE